MTEETINDKDALDEMFDVSADNDGSAEKEEISTEEEKPEEKASAEDKSVEEENVGVSEEELEKALVAEESQKSKLERLERDYGASSKEAKRLSTERKTIDAALAEQGLKLVIKGDKLDLIPTEKYSKDGKPYEPEKIDLNKLSVADIDALESGDVSEIQKVFDKLLSSVAENAKAKLVRAEPTRDKEAPTISQEKIDSVFDYLANAKDELDMQKHENIATNRKLIENYINNSAQPQALREAFAQAPETVAALVNSYINATRQALIKRAEAAKSAAEKKAQENQRKSKSQASDEGAVRHSGGADSFLDSIGKSRFG